MKKIISLIIILAICISSVNVFSAEGGEEALDEEIVVSDEFMEANDFLSALGVINIEKSNANNNVLRKDFVKNLYKLVTNSDFTIDENAECIFSDITEAEYIPYINAMAKANVVRGFSQGEFGGDSEITSFEAITLIIRALGRDIVADSLGGYPYGYITDAKRNNILNNETVNSTTFLTNEKMVIYFKRALEVKLYDRIINGKDGLSYEETNSTLLESLYRTGKSEGIIDGIDSTNLYGDNDVAPWHIRINDLILHVGETNPEKFLGCYVTVYYDYDKERVIYIYENPNKNKKVVINIEDIISIKNNEIITELNDKEVKYEFTSKSSVIYNNASTNCKFNMDIFKDDKGALLGGNVTLIDNNSDKGYDVIKIWAGKNIAVKSIDSINSTVEDINSGKQYEFDTKKEDPFVEIFDAEGNSCSFENILKNASITIYETKDDAPQKLVRCYVSDKVSAGKPSNVEEIDGIIYITVGEETFRVAKDSEKYFRNPEGSVEKLKITSGGAYKFMVNYKNEIVSFGIGNLSGQFGFIVKAKLRVEDLEEIAYIRIFDTAKTFKNYILAENVKLDGVMYNNKKMYYLNSSEGMSMNKYILKYLQASSCIDYDKSLDNIKENNYTQGIIFGTNSNGEINYIDTVCSEYGVAATHDTISTDNVLYAKGVSESRTYNNGYPNAFTSYTGDIFISDSAKVFWTPYWSDSASGEDTKFGITTRSSGLIDGFSYTIRAYYTDANTVMSEIATKRTSVGAGIGYNVDTAIVEKVSETVNQDGIALYKIKYWKAGNFRESFIYEDIYASANYYDKSGNYVSKKIYGKDLKPGDIIVFGYDGDSVINTFIVLYSSIEDLVYNTWHKSDNCELSDSTNSYHHIYYGYPCEILNDGIAFKVTDDINNMADESLKTSRYYTGFTKSIHFNRKTKKLTVAKPQNVKTYNSYVNEASRIVLQVERSRINYMYIID